MSDIFTSFYFTYDVAFLRHKVCEGNCNMAKQLNYAMCQWSLTIYQWPPICWNPGFRFCMILAQGIVLSSTLQITVWVPYTDMCAADEWQFCVTNGWRRSIVISRLFSIQTHRQFWQARQNTGPECIGLTRCWSFPSDFMYNVSLVVHKLLSKGYRKRYTWSYVRRIIQ